jgi:alkylation response protein AidB-like acyl-CoA dehydrogenase
MLDLGIDHGAQRKQFGKPIGSFQAVKHLLADVAVKIEFARPVVWRAAYGLSRNDPRAAVQVSHARLAAGDAALLAARRSLQVHGAMGYTWESDLQMFMKRAWALDAAWGDRAFHKTRVAAHLLADASGIGPGATFT